MPDKIEYKVLEGLEDELNADYSTMLDKLNESLLLKTATSIAKNAKKSLYARSIGRQIQRAQE